MKTDIKTNQTPGSEQIAEPKKRRRGAPKGNANAFRHGLSGIEKRRKDKALTRSERGARNRILRELVADAGGVDEIPTSKLLLAQIIAHDAATYSTMQKAIRDLFKLKPEARKNLAILAKLDGYTRPVSNSLAANLSRFGFAKAALPTKTLEELLSEDDDEATADRPSSNE